tara:strand:- start:138 stop:644 length:507 start_codon:yes stop_codon:yes gene_type:complete
MSIYNSIKIIFVFSFLVSCTGNKSGNNGVSNDIFGQSNSNFGEISQSSIEFFNSSIGDTILFNVDESTLRNQAINVLNDQANWLKENQSLPITIEGHADEQGTREYNLALGARRATAVRNYLVSQGVDETLLSIVTYGKERPIEVCSEEKCWQQNRRAVTVVTGGLGN